jgi:hypothetical protein
MVCKHHLHIHASTQHALAQPGIRLVQQETVHWPASVRVHLSCQGLLHTWHAHGAMVIVCAAGLLGCGKGCTAAASAPAAATAPDRVCTRQSHDMHVPPVLCTAWRVPTSTHSTADAPNTWGPTHHHTWNHMRMPARLMCVPSGLPNCGNSGSTQCPRGYAHLPHLGAACEVSGSNRPLVHGTAVPTPMRDAPVCTC